MSETRTQRLRELLQARARLDQRILALAPHLARTVLPGVVATQPRREAQHGTDSGYYRHRRNPNGWDPTPCKQCRAAHAAVTRLRKVTAA